MNIFARSRDTFHDEKIPKLTKFFYPWSGIFRDACYVIVASFLQQYILTAGVLSNNSDIYLAQVHVITIALALALIWDGLNDPLMGYLVEKFHFKMGKFKPWILFGSLGTFAVVCMMFSIRPEGNDGWNFVIYIICMYLLWDGFYTMNDVGYWSMLPSLTNNPKERNKLTSKVSIAATIGQALMCIILFMLPSIMGTGIVYLTVSIISAALYLISQVLVFFLCKEKDRKLYENAEKSKTRFLDLFILLKKNKELRAVVISLLFYYIGSALLLTVGLDYFYLVYGFSGFQGSIVAGAFSVFFIVGTLCAQILFTRINKLFSKKQILSFSIVLVILGYVLGLLLGFPIFSDRPIADSSFSSSATLFESIKIALGGTMGLLYMSAFFIFFGQGLINLCILIMFQESMDFGEYKLGERKEGICFAWRPLDSKLASASISGLRTIAFHVSLLYVGLNRISNIENNRFAGNYGEAPDFSSSFIGEDLITGEKTTRTYNGDINKILFGIKSENFAILGYFIVFSCLICLIISYLILRFRFSLNEESVEFISKELQKRHKEVEEKSD